MQTTDPAVAEGRDAYIRANPGASALPPPPALGPGLHDGGDRARAGQLGIQPILADGIRLDDMVGPRFLVATDRAALRRARPAATKAVLDERRRHRDPVDPAKVGQLLAAVGARAVVVRPDRYILGPRRHAADLERLIRSIPSIAASPHTRHPLNRDTGEPPWHSARSPTCGTSTSRSRLRQAGRVLQEPLGADRRRHDDGDVTYFAAEGSPEQYVIRVREAADKRLDLVAFGAADRAAVDALAQNLATEGVQLVGEPD